MSAIALKKAANLPLARGLDLEGKLVLMLIADRADDDGRYSPPDEEEMMSEIAREMNAINARLRGEFVISPKVDSFRVTRVVQALEEAEIRRPATLQ